MGMGPRYELRYLRRLIADKKSPSLVGAHKGCYDQIAFSGKKR